MPDPDVLPTTAPGRGWWLRLWAIPTTLLVAVAIAMEYSPLDVALLAPFHDPALKGFPLRSHWFFASVLHTAGKWLVLLTAIGVFLAGLASWRFANLRVWRWPGIYLGLCVAATSGIVGFLKAVTNRFPPWSLDLFGGEVPLTPLFAGTPAPFHDGRGFPAGHASGAFAWVALWFVGRSWYAPRLRWWLFPGLAGGLLFAWTQHVRGAHFASHNLWTLAIAWTVAVGFAAAFARAGLLPQPVPAPLSRFLELPMAVPVRSWLLGIGGMLAGCALFAVDSAVEMLQVGPPGLHFWIECIEFSLVGPGLGLICLLLAERLRITRESARTQAQAERERRLLVLGRMAAAVAHEVRNPLHTLRLVMDELSVEQPPLRDHPLRIHIDDSLERIDRAVDLVYRLARPDAEDDGAGDLVAIVGEAQGALLLRLPERIITLDRLPAQAPVRCSASGARIMIDNLLRNALEASEPAGVVTVAIDPEPRGWRLRVTNPGRLSSEQLDTAGEGPLMTRKSEGLGLGLAITRHLASGVGGSVTLTSRDQVVIAELVLPAWKDSHER